MNVLVYFEATQKRSAQRTIALLAEKFAFDLDLLVSMANADSDSWSKNVRGKTRVLQAEGVFEQAIIRACNVKQYDLVVAAPSARSGIVRTLLGSRIGRLVGDAPATIWAPRGDDVSLHRIVVGVSGGPQSEQDAQLAARLAKAYGARLELAYVVSQVPLFYTTFAEFHKALENDSTIALMAPGIMELRRIQMLLNDSGIDVKVDVRTGAVADELVSVCQGDGKVPPANLLVIGAHARSQYPGTDYLENLTEEIVELAPCATLVVHAKSEWVEWRIVE